jgi:hypothetical protein
MTIQTKIAASTDRPGYITKFNADGSVRGWVPDWNDPVALARIEAEIQNDYFLSHPVTSSFGAIARASALAEGKTR